MTMDKPPLSCQFGDSGLGLLQIRILHIQKRQEK